MAKNWRAVLPGGAVLLHQAKPRFMHERSGLQRVTRSLAVKLDRRHASQLGVDERHERVSRSRIALLPLMQQLCDLRASVVCHSRLDRPRLPAGRASRDQLRAARMRILFQRACVISRRRAPERSIESDDAKTALEIDQGQTRFL